MKKSIYILLFALTAFLSVGCKEKVQGDELMEKPRHSLKEYSELIGRDTRDIKEMSKGVKTAPAKEEKRFEVVSYCRGWGEHYKFVVVRDNKTGVNYLCSDGGLCVLVDADGKPLVTK